jgi:signal transduction histidine kinase
MGFVVTFRTKLLSIVGIAALAFVALDVATVLLGNRLERQLATIQELYLPKLELGPELDVQFDRLRRAFQDAVASGDLDELATADAAKAHFLSALDAAKTAIRPGAAAELRSALDDYYVAARDVSQRLIKNETGERVVTDLAAMQTKQARVIALVARLTAFDRHELAGAFEASVRAERSARTYQIGVGAACLAVVLFLSLALSRNVLRVVAALGTGLQRFGTGDFSVPIRIVDQDELGRVAQYANQMAASLDLLEGQRRHAEMALRLSNRELEAFSYSVAHDLRAPLRGINGFSHALLEDHADALDAEGKDYLRRIAAAAGRMGELIDALLALSRVSRAELRREHVDVTKLADAVANQLRTTYPDRSVEFVNQDGLVAEADRVLVRAVLENLIGNAWKFTGKTGHARVAFGAEVEGGANVYYVRDNGAGFDMAYAAKLFAPFQRLHAMEEFAGTGVGLATVERIVHRHGGRIWADGTVGKGATFHFTLPSHKEGAGA